MGQVLLDSTGVIFECILFFLKVAHITSSRSQMMPLYSSPHYVITDGFIENVSLISGAWLYIYFTHYVLHYPHRKS